MTRLIIVLGMAAAAALITTQAQADDDGVGRISVGVAAANLRVGTPPDVIDPDFAVTPLAVGTDILENPSGLITQFGLLANGVPTEPDQNTYLVLDHNPGGPTPGVDYGRHFLIQGHENAGDLAYVTRISLDVPRSSPNRITLLTPANPPLGKTGFNAIDGSTYDPFTNTLLFTQEAGAAGGVIQISVDWEPQINTLDAFFGKAGYEGIHPDDKGNIYLQEDVGGTTSRNPAILNARQPNSFVYRYVPNNPRRLEDGGQLQALQVIVDDSPVVFGGPLSVDADISSTAQLRLHTSGSSFPIRWVTVHTSQAGDTAPFDANQAAKAAGATPFKRPENMAWLPGSEFRSFFFAATGDTDAVAGENPFLQARGAYGAIFQVDLRDDDKSHHDRKADDGRISLFFLGDTVHNSFDNLAFANGKQLLAGEDRGDTLHAQLNMLDSVWSLDVKSKNKQPIRFIALGRDATSLADGEDNEPTGVFVSNGSASPKQLLGTEESLDDARGFFTRQHGDNIVFEFFRKRDRRLAGTR